MLTLLRTLLSGALLLALAAPTSAQMDASLKMDCFEKLLASVEEAFETYGDDPTGPIPTRSLTIRITDDKGNTKGWYVANNNNNLRGYPTAQFYTPDGEVTNCDAQPDECRELLEEAFGDGDGGSEITQPAEPPADAGQAPQSLPGGVPEYHYEFERARDGSLVFSAERRLRGVWGYRFEPRLCR